MKVAQKELDTERFHIYYLRYAWFLLRSSSLLVSDSFLREVQGMEIHRNLEMLQLNNCK